MKILNRNFKLSLSLFVVLHLKYAKVVFADYTYGEVKDVADVLQNAIIGIGILLGLFIVPYAAILMASGNQENIKKGREWLNSYITGLIVMLLAGIIIRIVGTEILGLTTP